MSTRLGLVWEENRTPNEANHRHNKKRDGRDYPKVDRTLRGSEDLIGGAKRYHQARVKEEGS